MDISVLRKLYHGFFELCSYWTDVAAAKLWRQRWNMKAIFNELHLCEILREKNSREDYELMTFLLVIPTPASIILSANAVA